jgi:hypothetical protein
MWMNGWYLQQAINDLWVELGPHHNPMEGEMEKKALSNLGRVGCRGLEYEPSQILLCTEPINTGTLEPIDLKWEGNKWQHPKNI